MTSPGKAIRLRRILGSDGRTVIMPLDHGLELGPLQGFEDARATLDMVVKAGVDAVLTSFGIASRYPDHFGRVGLILRLDGVVTSHGSDQELAEQMLTVADAVRIGADAVVANAYVGGANETSSLAVLGRLAAECAAWQMPLVAEMLLGAGVPPTVENVAMAARIGAELGGDVVKTHLVGDAARYRTVTSQCFAPIVILGGAKIDDAGAALRWARTAIDGGAAGTCIGRNVWQQADAPMVMQRLIEIVHGR